MFPFNKNSRKGQPRQRRGQNVTEYLILFAGVLVVIIVAASPGGFFTQGVNKALNMMFDSVEDMATVQCLGTLDDVNGGWSNYGSWAACASCSQTRTRACTNPAPNCNGSACTLADGTLGLIETESQSCSSGTWVTGTCGACTGACGSTTGTCAQVVTCSGGCCNPASEPSSTASCTKLPYPDVWVEFSNWACGASCGAAIAGQTVTCSGMCCDASIKPPTRRACTDGCCTENLYIGWDIVNNTAFTADFIGPMANGQSYSAGCPLGYAGNPTRTCTATASGTCTGDDSYSPPASCYTIYWGALTGECLPASCPAVSVDAGYGRTWDVPFALSGATAMLDCSSGGMSYTGTASYDCWLGAWQNLNAGCIPNCPAETVSIGAGLSYTFPETVDGGSVNVSCASYDQGPGCGPMRYEGTVSRSCNAGTWSGITGSCGYRSCGTEYFMDPNGFVQGTFTGPAAHGTPQTISCDAVDSRYTGDFSRTCDYGQWCSPGGGCTADPCPDQTMNSNGVNVTFTAAAHGTPQTLDCNTFNSNYTGQVSATCDFGAWINLTGGCEAFQCINPISQSNATMCAGDNTALTADTSWSMVSNGGCTATKCEYACNSGYVIYPAGTCCQLACPSNACGIQTVCGQTYTGCPACCGNGAIDSGEQCDGTNLSGQSCSTLGYSGGTLACNSSCTFNTAGCCNAVNGTWGGWSACSSCQQARTCSATCGGTCPADSSDPDNDGIRSCYSGTWSTGTWGACSVPCGGGTQIRTVTCSSSCCDPTTQPATSQGCNTQACQYTSGAWQDGWFCCGDWPNNNEVGVNGGIDTCDGNAYTQYNACSGPPKICNDTWDYWNGSCPFCGQGPNGSYRTVNCI